MSRAHSYSHSRAHSPSFQSLHLRHSSFWFSKLSVASPTSQLILQTFPCFTYITTHSPTLVLLHLRHSSFSNPSFVSPTSQDFRNITWWVAHSPTFLLLHLRHSSFSNPSVALPTSQLILQPFCCLTYVTAHSPTLPSLYLCHSSFSNPSVASPTSQLILQPFFRFSYVTSSSLNSSGEPPMQRPTPSVDGWVWFRMTMMARWYPGTNVAQISWHLSYSWRKPRKNLNQGTGQTGDLIRARCVRSNYLPLDHSGDLFNI